MEPEPIEPAKPDHVAMQRLGEAIMKDIDYHVSEYNLTYYQVIGGLEMIKLNMYRDLMGGFEGEEDEEDD